MIVFVALKENELLGVAANLVAAQQLCEERRRFPGPTPLSWDLGPFPNALPWQPARGQIAALGTLPGNTDHDFEIYRFDAIE